ncbi:MAG: hypothetical protein KBD83_01080 [Gammaproteobacteria bacterium]|nr:hypothetical protein [Gammaproteobacteria bacterium]
MNIKKLATAIFALVCWMNAIAGGNQSKATCTNNGTTYKYKCQKNSHWDSSLWCLYNDNNEITCQPEHSGADNCEQSGEVFKPDNGPYDYLDSSECTYKN